LPLILAALPEHQHLFHKVSNNLSLLPNGINKSKVYRTRWAGERCLGNMEPYYNNTIENLWSLPPSKITRYKW
jgi:hypothetical protein